MTKQLLLVLALTALGTLGVFIFTPLCGVIAYYVLGILRPQELWDYAMPPGVSWSFYVGVATLLAGFLAALGALPDRRPPAPLRPLFGRGHLLMFGFGVWIFVTYLLAQNQDAAYTWSMEYLKLILIFAASAVIIKTVHEIRALMICAVVALAYLCIEYNLDYLKTGYLRIYNRGHGGMDNNGAGLMLAMAIPLFYFLFEALTSRWRWLLLLVIPPAVHAVQMSYSRGAMLSLIAILPLIVLRSRHRKWLLLALLLLGPPLIYVTAGKQIQERFFSIATAEQMDESARMRFMSWNAAIKIASEHPIFGVGVRNSNLISYKYGADREGRTIHSTYLQIAADNGFVGLGIYVLMLLSVWREIRSVRVATRGLDDPESRLYYGLAAGVETSMAAFCFGSLFLSLEIFELPYMLLLCGSQLALLYAHRLGPIVDPLGYLNAPAQ